MTESPLIPTTPSKTEESPLAEALPTSLDELFSADPLSLSDYQVDVICAAFRKQRENFSIEDTSAKKEGRSVKPKVITKVDLNDLDIDIL